ncbi:hypothetical protein ACFP50_14590, partial [Streptomyces pratens]
TSSAYPVTCRFPEKIDFASALPIGIEIDDQHAAALTINPDTFHGEWNYTIPPQPGVPAVPLQPPNRRAHPRHAHTFDTTMATHPVLTGMTRHELDQLTADVRTLIDQIPTGQRPRHRKLAVESMIWATVLDQHGLPCSPTAHLFRIGENQMRALIKQVRPLLQQHGHHAEPLPIRLVDPSELAAHVMRTTSTPDRHDMPH